MTRIYSLIGLGAEDVAEAMEIAKEIAADPECEAWAKRDVQTGQPVALVVTLPD